jgi:hypothetical protein
MGTEKNTANNVAARITLDLSTVRARIRQLQENGATMDDVRALRGELGSLITIQSCRVLS